MKSEGNFSGRSPQIPAKGSSNKTISLDDLVTALTLVACAIIALLLPSALWRWASRLSASTHLSIKKPNLASTAKVLNSENIEVSAHQLAHDLLSGNYLENIETMSEYFGYKGERNVVVEGAANVEQALESGRGVILWHSPFGGAALFEKRAYKCAGLSVTHVRSNSHPYSSTDFGLRFLNPIRTRIENRYLGDVITLVPGGDRAAFKKMTGALQKNQVLSITAIGSGKNPIKIPFLGGQLVLALSVPSLAYATGAIVIPTATEIHSDQRYVIEFERPLEADYGLTKLEFRKALVEAYAARLEPRVREHPGSWRGWILTHTWQTPTQPT